MPTNATWKSWGRCWRGRRYEWATGIIGPIQGGKGADIVPPSSIRRANSPGKARRRTLRGYRADWRDFCAWCESHAICWLPAVPETAAYIAECAGRLKVGSMQRR
jgi:hypothetical protein